MSEVPTRHGTPACQTPESYALRTDGCIIALWKKICFVIDINVYVIKCKRAIIRNCWLNIASYHEVSQNAVTSNKSPFGSETDRPVFHNSLNGLSSVQRHVKRESMQQRKRMERKMKGKRFVLKY